MRSFVLILCLLLGDAAAHAESRVWMTPEISVSQSDLIAIVALSTVSQIVSPEGIRVRSVNARIERTIFWRFATDVPLMKLPESIVIYEVDPYNGMTSAGSLLSNAHEGRCLVFLTAHGPARFCPYNPFSVRNIEQGTVSWPTNPGKVEMFSVDRAIRELQTLLPK